jgi:leucyl aminopeptidase
LDREVATAITQTIKLGDFKGKLYSIIPIYTHGKVAATRIFLVGGGKKSEIDQRIAKNLAGVAARRALKLGVKRLAVYLGDELKAGQVVEGVGLSTFDPGSYKTKKEDAPALEELILIGNTDLREIKISQVNVESTNWIRKLINEPANLMTPAKMVE